MCTGAFTGQAQTCSALSTGVTIISGYQSKRVCAVTRYKCKSELYAADLTLDVNSSIYPLSVSGRYTMRLSMTLLPDVSLQKDEYDAVRLLLRFYKRSPA